MTIAHTMQMMNEFHFMLQIQESHLKYLNACVLMLYGVFESTQYIYFVYEPFSMTLSGLRKIKDYDDDKQNNDKEDYVKLYIIRPLLRTLSDLAQLNIVHTNIHLSNMVYTGNGNHWKLTGFHCAIHELQYQGTLDSPLFQVGVLTYDLFMDPRYDVSSSLRHFIASCTKHRYWCLGWQEHLEQFIYHPWIICSSVWFRNHEGLMDASFSEKLRKFSNENKREEQNTQADQNVPQLQRTRTSMTDYTDYTNYTDYEEHNSKKPNIVRKLSQFWRHFI